VSNLLSAAVWSRRERSSHRRCRLDATVWWRLVGVGGVHQTCCVCADPMLRSSALQIPDKTVVIIAGVSLLTFIIAVVCLLIARRRRRLKRRAEQAARYGTFPSGVITTH